VDPDDLLEMIRAIVPGDLQVWVGGNAIEPGIAYGLRLAAARRLRADGASRDLPHFSINGVDFSLLGLLSRPCWIGGADGVGPLGMAQALFMDLSVGDALLYEREIRVGSRADVASVTDQLWRDAPLVTGRIDDPSARLHVDRKDGAPVTEVRPERDGSFAFRIPRGAYRLRALASGARALERTSGWGRLESSSRHSRWEQRAGCAYRRGEPCAWCSWGLKPRRARAWATTSWGSASGRRASRRRSRATRCP
jgi:hypothetical protein